MQTCLVAEAKHEHVDQVAAAPGCAGFSVGEFHRVPEHGGTRDVPVAQQRLCQVALRAADTLSAIRADFSVRGPRYVATSDGRLANT